MDPSSFRSIAFPPLEEAAPDGLLMCGGELTSDWLVSAYSQGIFPWPWVEQGREMLAWYAPDPRAVIDLETAHIPRRLQRRLRRGEFSFTVNRCFEEVVRRCALPRSRDSGTWITPRMVEAYCQLHQLGGAHSVESWSDGRLVGGLYGVSWGGFFAGESMFHEQRDASKAALAHLISLLQQYEFCLFDVQQASSHTQAFGAAMLPREVFLQRLQQALASPISFASLESRN